MIVVLSRDLYFETLKDFPIKKHGLINAAVELDMENYSPFKTSLFFSRRCSVTENGALVNLWFVKPEVLEFISTLQPLMVIPETAILALGKRDSIYQITLWGGHRLFVHVTEEGAIQSLLSKEDKLDLTTFKRSVGGPLESSRLKLVQGDAYWKKLRVFLKRPMPDFHLAFLTPELFFPRLKRVRLRQFAISAFCVYFVYLSLGTFLCFSIKRKYRNELHRLNHDVCLIKKARDEFLFKKKIVERIAAHTNNYTSKTSILNALDKTVPEGTWIKQIYMADNKVEVSGETPKASSLMENLRQYPGVSEPEFVSPVQKLKKSGNESFTISFLWNNTARMKK